MNLINRLAIAKRRANIEGLIIYVSDKGRVKIKLESWEKEAYKVEFKNGIQYVYEEGEQIQPEKEIAGTKKGRPIKKGVSKLPEISNEANDRDIQ